MKVTLDLTALVAKGELTPEEAKKLERLGRQDTGSLGSNILSGFGLVAVALGGGFLFPTAQSVIVMGVVAFALGLALVVNRQTRWAVFAQFCMVIGALAVFGGTAWLTNGDFYVALALSIGLLVAAFVSASALLGAIAILEFTVALGAGTAYLHASYFFGVDRPAYTIGALAVVALALFFASLRMPTAYERVAVISARTAVLLINLVFLVGSLFGDWTLGWPASWFSIAWAVLLLGVGLWGVFANRRWVVNAAAVFGAIHFYTQWFEYWGPNPFAILGAGILLILFGVALRWINGRFNGPPPLPAAT